MKNKLKELFLLTLIIGLFVFASISSGIQIKSIALVENPVEYSDNTTSKVELDNSIQDQFQLNQEESYTIPMSEGGVYRRGSVEFELNSSYDFLLFDFNINDSSGVEVIISPAIGTSIDEEEFEINFDVSDPEFNFIAFQSTFDFDLPMIIEFPAAFPGDYFTGVNFLDLSDQVIDTDDKVNLNITINHYPPGAIRKGETRRLFQSDAFGHIINIFDYFVQNGYSDPQGNIFLDRGDTTSGLDATDTHFFKAIGLSLYGIVRAGNLIANSNFRTPTETSDTLWNYLDMAVKIFEAANDTNNVAIDGSDVFYVNPTTGTTATLTDNAYMLFGIGEIVFEGARDPLRTQQQNQTLGQLLDWAKLLADSIINGFEDGVENGVYLENISGIGTSITQGDLIYLESLSILAEAFSELDFLTNNFSDEVGSSVVLSGNLFVESGEIRSKIDQYLILTDDTNARISMITNVTDSIGIGVEYYDTNLSLKSNTSSLIGNLAYAHHRTSSSEFKAASAITQNTLRFFEASDSDLLLSETMVINNGTILPKMISTLENTLFILIAQRLENNWKDPVLGNNPDVARSWGRKAIQHFNSLFNLMYDQVDTSFFALYDNQASVLVADDNIVDSNRFVSNAFVNTILSRIFPVQMGTIVSDQVQVFDIGRVELELSQIIISDSLNWWDYISSFSFQINVRINKFDYQIAETVDFADFFLDFGDETTKSTFLSFPYEPTSKGNYTIEILLEIEGHTLLSKNIELVSLGQGIPEFSLEQFDITDDTYTTGISFIDQSGNSLSSMQVKGSLGLPFEESQNLFGNKYIRTGRTDSSGKLALTFNTDAILQDGLINGTTLYNQSNIPEFKTILLFLNITNAQSFNLFTRIYVVEIQVRLMKPTLRISPTTLEITQGTTESFSFAVAALDSDQKPISNAILTYSLIEIPSIRNTVFTDADGEATITLRDTDLFELSKYAIIAKQGSNDLVDVNATISISFEAQKYPAKTIFRSINIRSNSLIITANPVQVNTKEKNILEAEISPIEIEVATTDLFSRIVNSFVHIKWEDSVNNQYFDLSEPQIHVSPHTFSIDPSGLPVGEYTLVVIAEKDGITTTERIQTINEGLNLEQDEVISNPQQVYRTIVIESATIEDVAITAISVLGAFVAAWVFDKFKEKALKITPFYISCPHCDEIIGRRRDVCPHCGRNVIKSSRGEDGNKDDVKNRNSNTTADYQNFKSDNS